jgi:hypothetical protein
MSVLNKLHFATLKKLENIAIYQQLVFQYDTKQESQDAK